MELAALARFSPGHAALCLDAGGGVLLLEFVTKLDGADDELAGVPAQVFVHMANFEALFKRKRECNCSNIS